MDRASAKELLFDDAVYIHRGDQYVVLNLDLENKRCFVESSNVNFFTDSIVKKDIKVLHEDQHTPAAGAEVLLGDVLVRTQVTKYKKLKFRSHENIGYGDIMIPEEEMHTRAVCLIFRPGTPGGDSFSRVSKKLKEDVIAGIGTLIKNVAPVFLLCDSRDIGIAERLKDPHTGFPSLYVYDVYPGGTGLSEGFLDAVQVILKASADLVTSCSCNEGCPSCIGPTEEAESGKGNRKHAVIGFLKGWLEEEYNGGAW
jgi:DEAD/DEAH box helicase domain-containing protein